MPSLPDSSLQTFLFITCTFSPNLLYHYLNLLHSDFWLSAIPLYFSKKFKEVLSGFLISTYVSALFGFTLFYLNLAFRNHEIGSYNGSYNWFIQWSIQWFYGAKPKEVHLTTSFSLCPERPATQETPHYWANPRVGQPQERLYFKTSSSAFFLYYNSLLYGYKVAHVA